MDNDFYTGMLPIIVVITLMLLFLLRNLPVMDKKLFSKLILWTFFSSLAFIVVFGFFFFMMFVADLNTAIESKIDGQRVLTNFEHFEGLIFDADNPGNTYFQLFFLSATSYLGLGYSVSLVGPIQIAIIIERFLGLALPLMFVVLIFQHHTKIRRDGQDTLFIYLNRGWQILRVKQSKTLKLQEVELVSPNADRMTELLFVSKNPDVDDAIKHFKIKWKNADIAMVPFFMKLLSDELRGKDNELAFKALEFSLIWDKIDVEQYSTLYSYLEEVQGNISLDSDISYSDIISIQKILEKNMPQIENDLINTIVEVSDDDK